jgi:hypothetical protein
MGKEELGGQCLRAHVVDLAHVYQEALGKNLDNDVACAAERELGDTTPSASAHAHIRNPARMVL